MSPAMKEGGHQQGLKRTLIAAVDPHQRDNVENEARARREQRLPGATLSDVVRDALDEFFNGDMEKAEALLTQAARALDASLTEPTPTLVREINDFLNR